MSSPPCQVNVVCLNCHSLFVGTKKYRGIRGTSFEVKSQPMSLHLRSFSCDGPCRHYYFEHGLSIIEFSSSIHHLEQKLPSNLEDCSIGSTSTPSMADHDATDSPQNNGGIFENSHIAYIPHGPSGNLIAFSEQFSTCVKKGMGPPVTTTTFMVHHYPHTSKRGSHRLLAGVNPNLNVELKTDKEQGERIGAAHCQVQVEDQ
jgi:hypothetical protein